MTEVEVEIDSSRLERITEVVSGHLKLALKNSICLKGLAFHTSMLVGKNVCNLKVDWSKELSIVRIHVECVIGILKQKYTILQGVLPINCCDSADEDSIRLFLFVVHLLIYGFL